jgi:hypothetical protein
MVMPAGFFTLGCEVGPLRLADGTGPVNTGVLPRYSTQCDKRHLTHQARKRLFYGAANVREVSGPRLPAVSTARIEIECVPGASPRTRMVRRDVDQLRFPIRTT